MQPISGGPFFFVTADRFPTRVDSYAKDVFCRTCACKFWTRINRKTAEILQHACLNRSRRQARNITESLHLHQYLCCCGCKRLGTCTHWSRCKLNSPQNEAGQAELNVELFYRGQPNPSNELSYPRSWTRTWSLRNGGVFVFQPTLTLHSA